MCGRFCHSGGARTYTTHSVKPRHPVLVSSDDSWLADFQGTSRENDRQRRLAAAEVFHTDKLIQVRVLLSATKSGLRPTRVQRYLGLLCDSETERFQLTQDSLDKLHNNLQEVSREGI